MSDIPALLERVPDERLAEMLATHAYIISEGAGRETCRAFTYETMHSILTELREHRSNAALLSAIKEPTNGR